MTPLEDMLPEEDQPTRTGKRREARRFDQTQLHDSVHGRRVQRDYAAHFFRWGWVARNHVKTGSTILDLGCGQDLPFLYVMSAISHRGLLPARYVGVDLNPLPNVKRPWATLLGEFCLHDRWEELRTYCFHCGSPILSGTSPLRAVNESTVCGVVENKTIYHEEKNGFDFILCFEVLEHMEKKDGLELLKIAHQLLAPGGRFYLSTPVYDGVARAVNHIHEYELGELKECVDWAGFEVVKRYGTFINKLDLLRVATPEHVKVYRELEEYYGPEVMATFLAPLYPDHARNNLWVLQKKEEL